MAWLKLLAWIALVASGAWVYCYPGFESFIALVVAMSAVIGFYVKGRRRAKASSVQNQAVSQGSSGIQAGRDVRVGSIRRSTDE